MLTEYELLVRLLLAIAVGVILGWEREKQHKPAGLRTHLFVALASALLMAMATDVFAADASRVAQGILTGIGFLGAGTIFRDKSHVHGLTTAASIWAVAGLGIAIGVGYYTAAIATAIVLSIVLRIGKLEKKR